MCQLARHVKNKSKTLMLAGILQPLPVPLQVWDNISLDFIEGLPSSYGKYIILVIIDRLTKYVHFVALSHPFTVRNVAKSFVENVVKLHGMPKSIISDHDPIFISNF